MEPIKKSTGYQLGTATGAGAISQQDTSEANMHASLSPVITDEIKIVDSQGHPRIIMSAKSGSPVIRLLQTDGAPSVEILLDSTGHPAVKLANPDLKGPTAALAVDDKGTHVKFDRQGGASSYLFLNGATEVAEWNAGCDSHAVDYAVKPVAHSSQPHAKEPVQ
jgi:hypothetical protein